MWCEHLVSTQSSYLEIADLVESNDEIKQLLGGLESRQDVATLLDVTDRQLRYLLYSPRYKKYEKFEIKKKTGGVRLIYSPNHALKDLQRKLNVILQQIYQPKPSTYGFVKGRGIVKNAEQHLRQKCVLNLDLKDFFSSINFGRVQGLLKAAPYNLRHEVATVLAQICCHEFEVDEQLNRRLPQGAPTSPVISNMICAPLDSQLQRLAKRHKCIYTRYADDITFSTSKSKFPFSLAFYSVGDKKWLLGKELLEVVEGNGFSVNEKKTRLATKYQHQEVTGITVNQDLNVKRDYVREIRSMLYVWRTHGLEKAEATFLEKFDKKHRLNSITPSFRSVVKGKIEFLGSVKGKSDPIYLKFTDELRVLAPELVSIDKLLNSPIVRAQIMTEGKTDIYHLRAAFSNLQKKGLFLSLAIDFVDLPPEKQGDSNLEKHCESLCIVTPQFPVIAIFDRDNSAILKKVHDDSKGFKSWGNGVYSFALPVPSHRHEDPEVCIELYYSNEEVTRLNLQDRRLFLNSEFSKKSYRHSENKILSTTKFNEVKNNSLKIIDSEVHDDADNNVALSKNDFAKCILNSNPGFDNFDFSEFSAIFEVIEKILQRHNLDSAV